MAVCRANIAAVNSQNHQLSRCVKRVFAYSTIASLIWLCAASIAFAQHTEVQDAGSGRKTQTDYDATNKVTQQRTVDSEGNVLEKVEYEYLSGYAAPPPTVIRQTTTTYAPDGKIRETTRQTFDENTNFTEELIRVFDDAGKQIGGHLLTHDPWSGTYACKDWNAPGQAYKRVECPEGEESSGGAETVKKFTVQEVSKALSDARAAEQQQKARPGRTIATPAARMPKKNDFGIVLPANASAGERVSGIVTDDAAGYEEIPEIHVTRLAVPAAIGDVQNLSGWTLQIGSEPTQSAMDTITFTVPKENSELNITLRQSGNPKHEISAQINLPKSPKKAIPRTFESVVLCLKSQLCMVSGPFNGDSHNTFAAFQSRPAKIVVETQHSALVAVPEEVEPGARPLFLSQGSKAVALPLVVADFTIKGNGREIEAGKTLIVSPTLDGPADIPDELWRAGNFPAANRDQARALVPDFKLHHKNEEKHDDKDSQEKEKEEQNHTSGGILVVVKNDTPDQISLRGSKKQMLVFHLNQESFKMGTFKFTEVVEVLKPAKVNLQGYTIPFLAPVHGQEFELNESSSQP